MKHRIALTALVATAALGFTGCGPEKPAESPSTPAPVETSPASPATSVTPRVVSATPTASPATASSSPSPAAQPTTATATATAPTTTASTPAPVSAPADWTTAHNARFGFAAPVPAGWQIAGDPANGDGFTANGPGGATVTYTGANVLTDPNVAGPCPDLRQHLVSQGVALTYASETAGGCVYSGTQGANIVYERQWVGQGSRVGMVWTYPAAQAEAINPLVERAGNEIAPGNLDVAH